MIVRLLLCRLKPLIPSVEDPRLSILPNYSSIPDWFRFQDSFVLVTNNVSKKTIAGKRHLDFDGKRHPDIVCLEAKQCVFVPSIFISWVTFSGDGWIYQSNPTNGIVSFTWEFNYLNNETTNKGENGQINIYKYFMWLYCLNIYDCMHIFYVFLIICLDEIP